jgi:hypothetical protein
MKDGPVFRKAPRAAATWVVMALVVIAAFVLLADDRAGLSGWLPYLLLAACPLIHLFHGRGHGHGHHGRGQASSEPAPPDRASTDPRDPGASASPRTHPHS